MRIESRLSLWVRVVGYAGLLAFSNGGCALDWTRPTEQAEAGEPSDPDHEQEETPIVTTEDPAGAEASSELDAGAEEDDSGLVPDEDLDSGDEEVADAVAGDMDSAPETPLEAGEAAEAGDVIAMDGEIALAFDAGRSTSACSPACAEHQTCDEAQRRCRCDATYYNDGSRCVLDPCAVNPCRKNEACSVVAGKAECSCAQGYTDCLGTCVDLQTDPGHCGKCDLACAGTLQCKQSACEQRVHELVLGEANSCALLESGGTSYALTCWGYGQFGLYRDAQETSSSVPRDVVGVDKARAVLLAPDHRCVVLPDRDALRCWGACTSECGVSDPTSDSEMNDSEAADVVAVAGAAVVVGFAGWGNSCALKRSGSLTCMGNAALITQQVNNSALRAIDVPGVAPRFRDISGIFQHMCGTVSTGEQRRVACWGTNYAGELGAPTPADASPVYVQRDEGGDLTGVLSTSAGTGASCSVVDSGDVYCWGDNSNGGLGHGDTATHAGAVKVLGVSQAVQVAVGGGYACARVQNGDLYCWGSVHSLGIGNVIGDAGNGYYLSSAQHVSSLHGVLEIRAGTGHACARLATGAVMCWGVNDSGQLGDGTFVDHSLPALVPGLL
jgi:alpha-tubulin suppressor-like RCC1 family protein